MLTHKTIYKKALLPLAIMMMGLVGCADMAAPQTSIAHNAYQKPAIQMVIAGGDSTMQAWTQAAVTAYCAKKYWPASIRKISHMSAANQPSFNQPKKSKVVVNKDNTLHIHFQLGGVLMDNFSHELIVYPPHLKQCSAAPLHYEVTMQPNGNAVIYMSKPQLPTLAQ